MAVMKRYILYIKEIQWRGNKREMITKEKAYNVMPKPYKQSTLSFGICPSLNAININLKIINCAREICFTIL
jgi:hypothetical protein